MVVAEFYGLFMVYGRYNCNYTVTIVFMGFTKQQTKPLGAPSCVPCLNLIKIPYKSCGS
jgi:hypothetical protein